MDIDQSFPKMPRQAGLYHHTRRKGHHFLYNAAASRPVSKKEIDEKGLDGKPRKAMDAEWNKLLERKCFNFDEYFESKDLCRLCQDGKRKKCHIGLVFGICVEKAFHLKEDDERRR